MEQFCLYSVRLRRGLAALLFAVLVCVGAWPAYARNRQEPQVLRVAFPTTKGMTERDENGAYAGYTYEYLQEIAQYTGWQYEFVELEGDINDVLGQMLSMVATGELDLMGGVVQSEDLTQVYDYPGYSYGVGYTVLCVQAGNTVINESNYQELNVLRVAILEKAMVRRQELVQFCEASGIAYELIECANEAELLQAIGSGRADAMLSTDQSLPEDVRVIAKFAPKPYYFITTKGKSDIVNKLNAAILKVNETDPYFAAGLYEKYFSPKTMELSFSEKEKELIRLSPPLRVAMMPGRAPLEYVDGNGVARGITIDVLSHISALTGLTFEYEIAETYDEFSKMVQDGRADLMAGILYDYDLSSKFEVGLSRSYLNSQVVLAVSDRIDPTQLQGKRLALAKSADNQADFQGEVIWYETVAECVEAVQDGRADYCYSSGYAVQYYAGATSDSHLLFIPLSEEIQKYCFGVRHTTDAELLTIINKAILNLSESDLQTVIYRNTILPHEQITLLGFLRSNPVEALVTVVLLGVLIIGCLVWVFQVKIRSSRRTALDNERYRQLSELSGEYLFEYDHRHDRLTLTDKCARFFGSVPVWEHYREEMKRRLNSGLELVGAMYERIESLQGGTNDVCYELPDQTRRWLRISSKIIRSDDGEPLLSIGKVVDIQSEMEERERLLEEARRDGLTQLFNAVTSRQIIADSLADPDAPPGVLFITDVDRFKDINDQFGHFVGDQVLVEVANALRSACRKQDIIGRLGGDEFLIYMSGIQDREVVEDRCHMIRQRIKEIGAGGDSHPSVTLSIGAALSQPDQSYDQLYQEADRALYVVKNRGRNGFEIV